MNEIMDEPGHGNPADLLEVIYDRAGEVAEFEHVNVNFDDDRWESPVYEFRIKDATEGTIIRVTAVYEDEETS